MSLKAFHLVFIALSVTLASGFAAWCLRDFSRSGYVLLGLLSAASAVGLAAYGIRFARKTRDFGYL